MSIPLRGFPILVADANLLTRWVLTTALSNVGYTVREAHTGALLHATLESGPHLVLLDPTLPDPTGPDLFASIRRATPDSRVVLMSAPSTQLHDQARQQEVHGVLEKPFTIDCALGLVARLQR